MSPKHREKKTDINERRTERKRRRLPVPNRFRLSFYNEGSLNRIWTIGMSRGRLWLYCGLIVLGIAIIGACVISFTPLKVLLPGYLRPAERREYLEASHRLDSILERSHVMEAYLYNMEDVLTDGFNPDSAFMVAPPPLPPIDIDSLLKPTSAEAEYVERYLARHAFDLGSTDLGEEIPQFRTPVEDAIVSRGSSPALTKIILSRAINPVHAIAGGAVISATKANDGKWALVVQHSDGYATCYGGLDQIYCRQGSSVKAGNRLGVIKAAKPSSDRFDFSLWRNGVMLQPLDYIPF